jgi:hypothetical protein
MLYAFAFDRAGVVVGDLYFVDPRPNPGQEGAEQGVRLELRVVERSELTGSIYSAQPIAVDRPIWRADLLESVANPGSLDRAHHHPAFRGWEPGPRRFEAELTADPVAWLEKRLGELDAHHAELDHADAAAIKDAAPEIVDVVRRLLDRVRAAGHGAHDAPASARVGWL